MVGRRWRRARCGGITAETSSSGCWVVPRHPGAPRVIDRELVAADKSGSSRHAIPAVMDVYGPNNFYVIMDESR